MLFFGKKNPFDSEEDNTVALKGLPPVRVPVDDGNGGLKLVKIARFFFILFASSSNHQKPSVFFFLSLPLSLSQPCLSANKTKNHRQGFRTERSRSSAIKDCKEGVSSRCVSGAAGGCALSAARACAVEFPPPQPSQKKKKGPLGALQAIVFRGSSSKNDKSDESDESEEEKRQREAREECERRHREECLEFSARACGQHAESFCAVAVDSAPGEGFFVRRGADDRGRMRDIADELFESSPRSPGRGKR